MALTDSFKQTKDTYWVVVDVDEDGKEMKFELAYLSGTNKKLARLTAEMQKPYRRLIDAGKMPEKLADELAMKVFVKGVLVGWENVIVKTGQLPLEYNEDNAMMLFKELPELLQLLMLQSTNFENFKNTENEGAAKN